MPTRKTFTFGGDLNHGLVPPICWDRSYFGRPFFRQYVVEVPFIQPWLAPAPLFVPQPVVFDPHVIRPANRFVPQPDAENFAVKPNMPVNQPLGRANDMGQPRSFAGEHEIRRRAGVLKASTPAGANACRPVDFQR